MSTVILDISMSLDGFMTAANVRPEEPLGDGGQRLHAWAMSGADERNRQLLETAIAAEGATVAGRRTYDTSIAWWGADGPTGAARHPVFVVTHDPPPDPPAGGVYTFVTGGIEQALQAAKEAVGEKDVSVMGGADISQQYLRAGVVDEIHLHLVPVLLGSGTRMFEHLGSAPIELETVAVVETPQATHLRLRVVKGC